MMGGGGGVFREKSHKNCKHFSPFVRKLEHLSQVEEGGGHEESNQIFGGGGMEEGPPMSSMSPCVR